MKTAKLMCLAMVLVAIAGLAEAGDAATWPSADYIIGPGDVLDISVWKDEALSKLVTVLPDGRIAFPLIGEVTAGGKTLAQLSKELRTKLSRYVPDLDLSVIVHQVNSMMVYVIGRVNNPGRFLINSSVSVLQALAMAGGLNPFAKRSKIKILRNQGGQTKIFDFDYDDVSKGETLEQNIVLKRGDVIVVP
jgi:polysaccharide export outer membrane protein